MIPSFSTTRTVWRPHRHAPAADPTPPPVPRLLLLSALPPQLPACAYDPSLYLTLPCNYFHVSCIANLPSPFALTTRLLVSRGSVTVSQHKG